MRRLAAVAWLAVTLPTVVYAGWNPAGVNVRRTLRPITLVAACPDDSGGTVVVWQELNAPGVGTVHAQHLGPTGDVSPLWPDSGVVLNGTATQRGALGVIADHAGGMFVWWTEPARLVIQRVLFERGQTAAPWPSAGRRFGVATSPDGEPHVIEDGAGGLYAAWLTVSSTIAAIHLGRDGMGAGGWPNFPLVIGESQPGEELAIWPQIAVAGDHGAFVGWASMSFDSTLGPGRFRVRCVSASGANVSPWPVEGLDFGPMDPTMLPGSIAGIGSHLAIAPSGDGGAYVYVATTDPMWTASLYRLTADGTSSPGWPAQGLSVNQGYRALTAASYKLFANGGQGVATAEPEYDSWCRRTSYDMRFYQTGDTSVFIPTGVTEAHAWLARPDGGLFMADNATATNGIPCHGGGISLWEVPSQPLWHGFSQSYLLGGCPTFGGIALAATPDSGAVLFWSQTFWPDSGLFARRFNRAGEITFVPHTAWTPRQARRLAMERALFVPGRGVLARIDLPLGEQGTLELFDVQGRRLASTALAGARTPIDVTVPNTERLGVGVYFAQLRSARETARCRVAVLGLTTP